MARAQIVVLTPYLAQLKELRDALDGTISDQDASDLAFAIKQGGGGAQGGGGDRAITSRDQPRATMEATQEAVSRSLILGRTSESRRVSGRRRA